MSVKAVQREIERLLNEAVRPLGLTAAQADAVVVIGQVGPLSLRELGELLIAEAGHPSRLVDRLVDASIVERRAVGHDRRRVELSLTSRGRDLEDRVLAAHAQVLGVGRTRLGGHDPEPALEVLRRLLGGTPYAELIARRRDLLARRPRAAGLAD